MDKTTYEARREMISRVLNYDADDDDGDERRGRVSHGNTRLPYGLCEEFGIKLPEGASPKQAWEALEGKGVSATAAYKALKEDKNIKPYVDKIKKEGDNRSSTNKASEGASEGGKSAADHKPKFNKTLPVCNAKTLDEVVEFQDKHLGIKGEFKRTTDVMVANAVTNSIADAFEYAPKIKSAIHCCATYNGAKLKDEMSGAFKQYYRRIYKDYSDARATEWAKHAFKLQGVPKTTIAMHTTFIDPPGMFNEDEAKQFKEDGDRHTGIYICNTFGSSLNELDRIARESADSGYHPKGCDTGKAFFDHEVMHAITKAYGLLDNKEITDYINKNRGRVKSELARYPTEYEYKREKTFRDEVLSEAWAECLNSPNPRPMARDLGRMIWEAIQNDKE